MNPIFERLFRNPYGNAIDPAVADQLRRSSLMRLGAGMISNPSLANLFPLLSQTSDQFSGGLASAAEMALERQEEARKAALEERRVRVSERGENRLERLSRVDEENIRFDNEMVRQAAIRAAEEAAKTEQGISAWLDTIENPQHRAFAETMLAGGGTMSTIAGRIFDLQHPVPPAPKAPIKRSSGQANWLENYVTDESGRVVGVERVPGSTVTNVSRTPVKKERSAARSYIPADVNITHSQLSSMVNSLMNPETGANTQALSEKDAYEVAERELAEVAKKTALLDAVRNKEKIVRDLSNPEVSVNYPPEEVRMYLSLPQIYGSLPAEDFLVLYYTKLADESDRAALAQKIQSGESASTIVKFIIDNGLI